ncbi:DUF494 family protein, partial [bacterium]|nr:DUF494 family protein [bacterium]
KIQNGEDFLNQQDKVFDDLQKIGYSRSEVDGAMDWLIGKYGESKLRSKSDFRKLDKPLRVLSNTERKFFTRDAYGYLHKLQCLGLLDDDQFEMIIARGTLVNEDILDKDTIKALASLFLFDVDWPKNREIAAFWFGWKDTNTIH